MMLDWRWLRIALVVSITIVGLTVFTTHPASAATITVTSTADQPPGMADGCTLREAILAANGDAPVNECSAGSGADTIAFNIPGTGRQTIQLSSDLPSITSTVTLDGFTQPGSRPNSQAVGSDAVWNVSIDAHDHGPLSFDGRASTVQGLHITGVFAYSGTGSIILAGSGGHTVRGNHIVRNNAEAISVRSNNNLVGGTQPAARNVIALNASFGADIQFAIDVTGHTNRIQGNYIGTDPSGTDRLANINRVPGDAPYGSGVGLLGDGNLLGGTDAGAGNLIVADGVQVGRTGVENPESDGNVIQGNSIGSNVTGNVLTGGDVWIDQSVNTQVGGTTTAARNLLTAGIRTSSRARDARIEGNAIGTNAASTAGLGPGVTIQGSTGIIVGGLTSGAGNLIRGGAGAGVSVRDAATGIQILGNSIFSNQGLGIDLGNDGVTPNDDGDGDNGPNHLQNFPSFISAHTHGAASGLTIRFAGVPHRMYHVEAFLNDACDPSGYGEGQTLVLTDNLPTNADGRVGLSWTKYAQDPNHPVLPIGKFVTATLTDTVTGETSEFSPCAVVRQGGITTSPSTGQTTEAGGTATFTVALNSPTISSVEIAVSVSDPTEATVSPSILAFRPEDGTTPKTVTVTGLDDQEIDGDVMYTVILSPYNSTNEPTDPAFAGFDPHDVTLTNLDNDAGGVLQFATDTIVADESSGAAQVTVTRSGGVAGNVTVDVTTEPGTATPGDDYAGGTYPVAFGDGEASKTVSIPLVNDGITDPDETFAVRLQHPSGGGATLGSPSTATVVIAERGTVDGVIRQVGASGNYFPDDPRAPAGVYRLNVRFQNTGSDTFTDLQARITELTGGHTIVNRDGAPTSQPAGVGAVMTVHDDILGPDGNLTPSETFLFHIEIGLQRRESFRIAYTGTGLPVSAQATDSAAVGSARTRTGRVVLVGGGEFDPEQASSPVPTPGGTLTPTPQPAASPGTTPSPIATPAPAVTPTPSPTATPPASSSPVSGSPAACDPRPKIEVRTAQTGPGQLEATITTEATPGATENALRSIRLAGLVNARVQVAGGPALADRAVYTPPAGSREVKLLVTREQPGAMTAQLEIVDGCGTHATFVGAGAGMR